MANPRDSPGGKKSPKNLICQKIRENWPGWVPVTRGILERKHLGQFQTDISTSTPSSVMDFPPDWEVMGAEDFTTAGPRNAGPCGMELLAQVRPNGRILDHYRVTLGGSRILDINCKLSELLLCPATATLRFKYSTWPKDIDIKRNMSSSAWFDTYDLLASKRAAVIMEDNQLVPVDKLLEELKAAGNSASIRFAVVAGEDARMQLQLQCLPGSANTLMGKPLLRG